MKPSTYLHSVFTLFLLSSCEAGNVAQGVSENLYCEGCIATVKELIKLTSKKRNDPIDLVVSDALENICKPYNFVKYDYSPPKTVKACELLLERHEEEIEVAFAKKGKDLEHVVCYKISNACTNVDRSKKAKDSADIDLTTNGKTQKVQKEIKFDPQSGAHVEENSPKTLSKRDKRPKKPKKTTKKDNPENSKKKEAGKGAADIFQVDINDPSSLDKVLAQIKQVTEDHKKDFYQKQAEEDRKEAKDEL